MVFIEGLPQAFFSPHCLLNSKMTLMIHFKTRDKAKISLSAESSPLLMFQMEANNDYMQKKKAIRRGVHM